jgi:hypothetical protein
MKHDFIVCSSIVACLASSMLYVAASGPGAVQQAKPPVVAPGGPAFEPVQPDLFTASGAQPNCWADYDNDGDLDLFVGFKADLPNRLYRNDNGVFGDVAAGLGLADLPDTRAAAWGDFNGDGHMDLYVGFTKRSNTPNRLYRNDGNGRRFTEVAHEMGVDVSGFETRQVAWVDYDTDGKADLFIALRDGPNMLFHNDGAAFRNVAKDLGVDDPRKTVGAVWFDYNEDGRLDLFVANQDGDRNGLWRNDGTRFVDVAAELGIDGNAPGRIGSNGPSVVDFNNDGRLDLFVAGYGRNFLYRNDGNSRFTDVAEQMGVTGGERATPSAWGDYDNDGRPDLYVSSYIDKAVNEKDYLYHNEGTRFVDVMTDALRKHGATHGVQWADYNRDGAIDLALADNNPAGSHCLLRNLLPPSLARRSIQVLVLDERGRYTRPGSEVRIYAAGTRSIVGGRIVDSGSGYVSQSAAPVHFGLGGVRRVDVEVTFFAGGGRRVTRVANVDPGKVKGGVLVVRASSGAGGK